eukprot:TRINITY_DN5382_c0_g1_i1.p2 TRINITY_DN5382_c0_g1~~TRINITY_DN5382_c0_g1_i1.p2  ORF type:complete len:123 (+),score=34.84 TRINITY_DN5382_c0_g1_i1:33-371(+)
MSVYGSTHLSNLRTTTDDLGNDSDDDWETDPGFENTQNEFEQRRGGAKKDAFDIHAVRDHARQQDDMHTKFQYESNATRYGVAKHDDDQQRQQMGAPKPQQPSGGTPGAPEW